MANELTIRTKLEYEKNGVVISHDFSGTFDVTGDRYIDHIQNIGTSEEALDLGDVGSGTLGWCLLKNLDTTNFVSVRRATGESDLVKLEAGESALFRLDGDATAPFAIADTAACNLLIVIIED